MTGKRTHVSPSYSKTSAFIWVINVASLVETLPGKEQESKLENDIKGDSVGSLIYQPGGCGEENMIHTSLTVTATSYLDQTNQWEPANIERRNEALQHIRTGGPGLRSPHRRLRNMAVNVACVFMQVTGHS